MRVRGSTLRVSALLFLAVAISRVVDFRQAYAQPAEPKSLAADIELSDQNYLAWRDHILPQNSELDWQQIPWLTTFKDGILTANQADKPLLFWTMNGHPLGCT